MSENLKPATDKKTIAYIDGYNLYRSVRDNWAEPEGKKRKKNPQLVKYHLWKLVRHCLKKICKETQSEDLERINFYTAPPVLLENRQKTDKKHFNIKHYEEWTNRQRELGVEIIEGVYRNRIRYFERNKIRYFEEKQTDVNVAVGMLSGAFEGLYNRAVLISDDTDYCRLILKCLELKKYVLVLGTARHSPIKKELCQGDLHSAECKQYIDGGTLDFYQINEDDIENCLDWEYIKQTSDDG